MVLGHSVTDLLKRAMPHSPSLTRLQDDAALLDQFHVPTRYPNGLPSPAVPSESYTASQAEAAERAAGRAVRAVEAHFAGG